MPRVKDVTDAELQQHGLKAPQLAFLSKDPGLVDLLLFQPSGQVIANNAGPRPADNQLMSVQMAGFLQQAVELGVDLAACPEYACPWNVLVESISSNVFPVTGKLWAIACEAVSVDDLRRFEATVAAHCKVIHEWPQAGVAGQYMDCLCFLFVTQDLHGNAVRVVLIQRKTHAMGGTTYEYEGLIPGDVLYRFGGPEDWKVVALLCSDVLAPRFQEEIVPQLRYDTLVVHLQLNSNPSSVGYRAYRDNCCSYAPRNTEIVCLNWARGTVLLENEKEIPLITEPKTIWFRSVQEVALSDEAITHNHREGCFFSYLETTRSAAFVFSPDQQLFHLKTTKPSVSGLATNAQRTGPVMVRRYVWDGTSWQIAATHSDDRFRSFWLDPHEPLRSLLEQYASKEIDCERLIQFCIGCGLDTGWNGVKELPSFRFASDDTSRRLRLCWSEDGEGFAYRDECLQAFQGFAGAVSNTARFSHRLAAFKDRVFSVSLVATPTHKSFRNLHIQDGPSATAVFLGLAPRLAKLNEIRARLTARLLDVNEDTELMAIWYLDPTGALADHMDTVTPAITSDPKKSPLDITNPAL
jgi:hypothetical protein